MFVCVPEALFDKSGRPLDAGFYTGSPAYHSLVYQIFEQGGNLASSLEVEREEMELPTTEMDNKIMVASSLCVRAEQLPEGAKLSVVVEDFSGKEVRT